MDTETDGVVNRKLPFLLRINSFLRLVARVFSLLRLRFLHDALNTLRVTYIISFLKKEFQLLIAAYMNRSESDVNAPPRIFVFWMQGEEAMPAIVKKCVESIKRHAGNIPVVFLHQENLAQYVQIPQYIYDKLNQGKMTYTHFSDILRCALLAKHGGIWMDATLLCTRALPEEYFRLPVFAGYKASKTAKRTKKTPIQLRWSSFLLGSGLSGSLFFCFLYDCLLQYWKHYDVLYDYFFIDHIIFLAYDSFPRVCEYIETSPENNVHCWALHRDRFNTLMNDVPSVPLLKSISRDTFIFKLTYKKCFQTMDTQGRKTLYGYILEDGFEELIRE